MGLGFGLELGLGLEPSSYLDMRRPTGEAPSRCTVSRRASSSLVRVRDRFRARIWVRARLRGRVMVRIWVGVRARFRVRARLRGRIMVSRTVAGGRVRAVRLGRAAWWRHLHGWRSPTPAWVSK